MTDGVVARLLKRAALLAALIGLATGTCYAARYVEMLVLLSSVVGSHDVVEDTVANARGDKVEATTQNSGNQQAPTVLSYV